MSDQPNPLLICARILEQLGNSGQVVWELGRWYQERRRDQLSLSERLKYLKYAITWLREKIVENQVSYAKNGYEIWRELPVDFRTFVESPAMLEKADILWPEVLRQGQELNSGKYTECVLTGGIGVAKSTLAIYTQIYQLYILSCMISPHEVFDQDPASEILIVMQSVNKNVATDIDYQRMRNIVITGPYFDDRFMFNQERESDMRFPRNIIVKPVSGTDQAALGANVIGGIIDEVNFMAVVEKSKQAHDGGVYDQAVQNYNAIASRRESRFAQLGVLPGMLCLVSSRNYPGQFTDRKELEAKSNPRIFVYDKRIWEIRPERFCGEKFRVFVGDETRKPRILKDQDVLPEADQELIMHIPVEMRVRFEDNILTALREQGGVATQALHPFMMNTDAISACFGKATNLLSRPDCDFVETRPMVYPSRIINKEQPRFCHIDLAMTQNSAGVAVGHVSKFVNVHRGEITETLPHMHFDVLLEVIPPRGGEIEFSYIRKLLYVLRQVGLPIKWVTMDTSQSRDTQQILFQQGFIVGTQSLDTDNTAYDFARQAIYDGRCAFPTHQKAQVELSRLEINPKNQRVDHGPTGSKDIADCIAGVCFGLTMRREIWNKFGVSIRTLPPSIAGPMAAAPKDSLSYKEMLRGNREMQRYGERKAEEAKYGKSPILVGDSENIRRRLA